MLNPWTLQREGFDESKAAPEESLFSLGNGYIGWRGNYEEGYSRPMGVEGCYLNGFHETEKIRYGEIAYGYAEESQTLLNVTGSQRILLRAEGAPLHPDQSLRTARTLRMQQGVLDRETVYAVHGGTLTVRVRRLVSFDHPHAAAIRMTLTADAPCRVSAAALLDGDVTNLVCTDDPRVGSGLHGRVLSLPRMAVTDAACGMVQHTGHTRLAEACAMACRVRGGEMLPAEATETTLTRRAEFALVPGQEAVVEKYVTYFSGAEAEEDALLTRALGEAESIAALGFDRLQQEQESYMARFWHRSGIRVEGDDELLQGLRFNMYHLLQSAGRDGKTNIAAKGLTGEGYEGHYFWDTETYIFPMFLHVAPEVARALLTYRYSILPCARDRAREMGHPVGALYPWRTINGREASAYYPAGTAQAHIDADIALAVKRYWEATGDDAFLAEMGAEMVCETARFYLDLGFYNPDKGGKFCINEVTGPDEYNALVDNNAYTNLM
ncbi:MAG: glycoside hydrolase family 65 protein, partial [Aristaeellaceae bacterium]